MSTCVKQAVWPPSESWRPVWPTSSTTPSPWSWDARSSYSTETCPKVFWTISRRSTPVDNGRAGIVHNLLSFARRHEPKKEFCDVAAILQQAIDLTAYDLRVHNITVTQRNAEAVSSTLVDQHQLLQVVVNILTNAQHALTEAHGGGHITTHVHEVGDRIRIVITDDGPGIRPEHLKRVFDPFFTTKEVGKGTDLGLSICYGIIKQHGGDLWAGSIPGKGASFFIELPITGSEADGHRPEEVLATMVAAPAKRVLVVDDEQEVRSVLARVLTEEGHMVELADGGEQALELLEHSGL